MGVVMSGRAGRFLRVLQELGHLDDEAWAQIVLAAAQEVGEARRIEVDVVRRHAARVLVERDGGRVADPLARDWDVLFS